MPHNYPGANTFPANIALVDDGDPGDAAILNAPLGQLADRTVYLAGVANTIAAYVNPYVKYGPVEMNAYEGTGVLVGTTGWAPFTGTMAQSSGGSGPDRIDIDAPTVGGVQGWQIGDVVDITYRRRMTVDQTSAGLYAAASLELWFSEWDGSAFSTWTPAGRTVAAVPFSCPPFSTGAVPAVGSAFEIAVTLTARYVIDTYAVNHALACSVYGAQKAGLAAISGTLLDDIVATWTIYRPR